MLLTELREQIEQGKIAQLFIPKTHEYGIDVTIKVLKKESQFIWQREKIEEPAIPLNLPAKTSQFETWDKLIEALQGGMQLRDTSWEIEKTIESEDAMSNDKNIAEAASEGELA
jgi:hypothetical protein